MKPVAVGAVAVEQVVTTGTRLISAVWCLLVVAGSAVAAEPRAALVVLAQGPSENVPIDRSARDEQSLVNRLNAVMVRNATKNRYGRSTFLVDDGADKDALFRSISRLANDGFAVDLMVLGGDSADSINLRSGAIGAQDIAVNLLQLRGLKTGGIRFVFTSSGSRLAPVWREAGAVTVLSYAGDMPPFFFPRFIKQWGAGRSVTQSAAEAGAFSSRLAESFSRFVPEATLAAHAGVLTSAPAFDGQDLNIAGDVQARALALNSVLWPEHAPKRANYRHTALAEGVIKIIARLLTPELELMPVHIAALPTLVDQFGDAAFSTAQGVFPGRNVNEMVLPGTDVRIILARFIPDLDSYMQELVNRLDSLQITRGDGKMLVDAWLAGDGIRFSLRDAKGSKTGQPYAVDLSRHLHFEISMKRDSITLGKIRGFTVQVKLPVVPDGVTPRKLRLDTSTETLTISAGAVKGLVEVVGKADVRAKKLTGVDWLATILKNAPLLLGLLLFGAT
ncbi:MAG: hypothetical protein HY074_19110 [Deltaproteobacteria bacterium]|nr:hypothetical protein [Deltaproteobacteria bacterium]